MSKCCVVQLPAMGQCCEHLKACCDPQQLKGEHEFTVKVKVLCSDGEAGCRIEFAPQGCCEPPAEGGKGK